MNNQRRSILCGLFLILTIGTVATGIQAQDIPDGDVITNYRPAQDYRPYTIRDLVDQGLVDSNALQMSESEARNQTIVITEPVSQQTNSPSQVTYLDTEGHEIVAAIKPIKYLSDQNLGITAAVKYEGTVGRYLDEMNNTERRIVNLGYSFHDDDRKAGVMEIYERYTNPKKIREQVMAALKMGKNAVLEKLIIEPIENCPLVTMEEVLNHIPDLYPGAKIPIPDGTLRDIEDVVMQIQNHQQVFCGLGIDLRKHLNTVMDSSFFQNFFDAEERFFNEIQIDRYVRGLGFPSIKKVKSYAEAAQDVAALIQSKELPGPEKLKEIADKLGVTVPPQYKIPNIPNLPQPTLADRSALSLKKRKDWSGLNFGSQNRVGTYANAYYELRGSETAQAAQALGVAGVYILGKKGDLINGTADFIAGQDEVSAKMVINVIGLTNKPIIDYRGKTFLKEDPQAGKFDFPEISTTIPFAIGPVPGYLTLGARGTIGFGYKIQLAYLRLFGEVAPYANASGYARGGVGLAGVMSMGATAELTIINVTLPLTGEAGVRFEEAGIPYLSLAINAKLDVKSLDGTVDGFVEYPWPEAKFCGPKYFRVPCGLSLGTKKINMNVYKWSGLHNAYRFLSWSMELSPFGTKLGGDFIDQADRAEAEGLKDKILLNERAAAINDYESKVNTRLSKVINTISSDFSSGPDQDIDQYTANQQATFEYNRQLSINLIDELYAF